MRQPDRDNQFAGDATPSGPAGSREDIVKEPRERPHRAPNDPAGPGEPAIDESPAAEQQRPVNEESMYEGRRSQDKEQPPSSS